MVNTLAINNGSFIEENMELITKETFDTLCLILLNWYKDEAKEDDAIPNLYWLLFEEVTPYSVQLYEAFRDSYRIRYFEKTGYDLEEDTEELNSAFFGAFDHLQEFILSDVEKILNNLKLVYCLQYIPDINSTCSLINPTISEVW